MSEDTIKNGLADAVGFPQNQGWPGSEQISQVTTVFKNLRYYFVSNMRQVLSQAYCEIGLVQTITDVPVDDALRGGIEVKSKQLDEAEIEELLSAIDRDDDITTAGTAAKWNRLFGGGGIVLFTNQDPETPLDIASLDENSEVEFRAVDLWELFYDAQNIGGYNPAIQDEEFEFYSYYGERIHKSRVMVLKGLLAPSFVRPRLRGWGFSVVEALVRSMNQYLKATDLGFEVLDEFKLDVYKIKNLVNTLMSPGGDEAVKRRVQVANWQKNYQNAVVMDAEDDFDHKQLSFAGLAEAMEGIRMQVASDMRMPLTKLFGISAAGFNSGEDDIEVYNSMVESTVRNKIKYPILKMLEIKCQVLFGFVPDDLKVSFKPLRVLSAEQEENVKTQKFARILQSRQTGELTIEEFRDACNKGNLFDIVLDTSDDLLSEIEAGQEADAALAAGAVDDDGANEPTTEKAGSAKAGTRGGKVTREGKDLPPDAPAAKDAPDRPKKDRTRNSIIFDRKSYEADGGDAWVDSGRAPFFSGSVPPMGADAALWARSREASMSAYGKIKWQFVLFMYKKYGGKFTNEKGHDE